MAGPTPAPSSSSSSWRNPSTSLQAKHNLVALPEDFEPTPEEKELLAMYDTVRTYEKEAARLKEQAAKAKLAAAAAKFEQQSQEKEGKKKKARKNKREHARHSLDTQDQNHDDNSNSSELDSDDDDNNMEEEEDEKDEDPASLHQRREAKLAQMREKLDEAKQTAEANAEAAEEALRAQHLAIMEEDVDIGISLKRKRLEPTQEKSSLIANLGNQATPPHDFSQKLALKSWAGKVLFPTSTEVNNWSPMATATNPSEGALTFQLVDFNIGQAQIGNGNNTLAIKFMAPSDSKRFSINIAGPDDEDFNDVWFHFNPRQHERGGQVVINEKTAGIWGQAINIPLSQLPLMFGQVSSTLVIQINGEGYDVFLDDRHCARLEHRHELPSRSCSLYLQFPSTDDYGSPESWMVYKVWWGNHSIMAKGDLSGVAGVNAFHAVHPKKLFISGLSRLSTDAEVELRRAELERAFRKYGGDRGVITTVPKNATFAFVEVETERNADLAFQEMQDKYRMNRARRSRHEALQEERAAAEAAKQGQRIETREWD